MGTDGHFYIWALMVTYGHLWVCICIYDHLWALMGTEVGSKSLGTYGHSKVWGIQKCIGH